MSGKYTAVIGLEVHVELKTKTKIFCSCSTEFGDEPNTNVCPVCYGMPGALPVLGEEHIALAVRAGLAFGCKINRTSWFDRKNYFYPDLPKGYQITQNERPICSGGGVRIKTDKGEKIVRLNRIHMEEDAGKLLHRGDETLIDYNRAGVGLIEIVSEPDMRTSDEAKAYLTQLRRILTYIGVSDCRMNEGSMRCDVNVSVMSEGCEVFGIKCEIKNVNSINYVGRAIDDEIGHQTAVLESGGDVIPETKRFNEHTGRCETMRVKENAVDYRYFTDPNIPPIVLSEEYINNVKNAMPTLPDDEAEELTREFGIKKDDAYLITSNRFTTEYFRRCAERTPYKIIAANLFVSEVITSLSEEMLESAEEYVPPSAFAEICTLFGDGKIVSGNAKKLLRLSKISGLTPLAIAENEGMLKITDRSQLMPYAEAAVKSNPKAVNDYLKGKTAALKTMVGYIMRSSNGSADPKSAEGLILELLENTREQ